MIVSHLAGCTSLRTSVPLHPKVRGRRSAEALGELHQRYPVSSSTANASTGAWQALRAFAKRLQDARGEKVEALCVTLLLVVSSHRVGDRPDRIEPRKR